MESCPNFIGGLYKTSKDRVTYSATKLSYFKLYKSPIESDGIMLKTGEYFLALDRDDFNLRREPCEAHLIAVKEPLDYQVDFYVRASFKFNSKRIIGDDDWYKYSKYDQINL